MIIYQHFPRKGKVEEGFAPPLRVVKLEVTIASPVLLSRGGDHGLTPLS